MVSYPNMYVNLAKKKKQTRKARGIYHNNNNASKGEIKVYPTPLHLYLVCVYIPYIVWLLLLVVVDITQTFNKVLGCDMKKKRKKFYYNK